MLLALVLVGLLSAEAPAQSRTKIRYALGDVISVDELPLLIAVERAKARGVDVELTSFKSEEIATQAVINGQSDVGQGTPYAALQKVNIPIRFFYQLMALQFSPSSTGTTRAKDDGRDGCTRAVGTEAIRT
jgi:NitT/TauT family transport system substrate-binding protein